MMLQQLLLLLLSLLLTPKVESMIYFVSPNASVMDGGKGSLQEPWALAHVLAGKTRLRAGDTVQLLDGVYTHALRRARVLSAAQLDDASMRLHCRSLKGTPQQPISACLWKITFIHCFTLFLFFVCSI
jgi:hypothetical protein